MYKIFSKTHDILLKEKTLSKILVDISQTNSNHIARNEYQKRYIWGWLNSIFNR